MTAHSQRAHARLAPSAAHRWMACPGSVSMSESIEEAPSVYAAEGTAAHELAAKCLEQGWDAERFKGWVVCPEPRDGETTFQSRGVADGVRTFLVDAEMVDGVQTYLDVAREVAQESDDFEIEQRLDISSFVPGMFGTGDFIAYRGDLKRITICDFKYGKGVAVDVRDNEQLLSYALGVAQRYHNRGVDEVELVVCQPRAPHHDGPTRRWVTDLVGLYEHAMALHRAAELARSPGAPLVAGAHCISGFCKAAGRCPALRARVFEIVNASQWGDERISSVSDPRLVPFRDWSVEEADMNLIKGWLKRREEHAHTEALRGNLPPGAKLVPKRPSRRWRDPEAAATQLQMLGVSDDDLFEPPSLRSPAQIEKALPKGDRGVVNELSEKVSSGTVLAPLNDPRGAVAGADSGFDAVEIDER